MKWLVYKGADPHLRIAKASSSTPLHQAATHDRLAVVKFCIEELKIPKDLKLAESLYSEPIHVASEENRHQVVSYLLSVGANVNAERSDGVQPLFLAAMEGHTETARILIAAGADTRHWWDRPVNTPYNIAKQKGHKEVLKLLKGTSGGKDDCLIQ